jgi:hypothetical protein
MNTIKVFLAIALLSLMATSCTKNPSSGTSAFAVRMTDAPGNYSAVNIDLQSVVVTTSSGAQVALNTHSGIYNLLTLTNGADTLIASGNVQGASVEQVSLILGPNNSVVVNGTTYPLSASAELSGLNVQISQGLQAGGTASALIDFDAGQSISLQTNGTYQLKPVIRPIVASTTGSITGAVSLAGSLVAVTATSASSGQSFSTTTQANGQFTLSGLSAGAYSITLTPPAPMQPVVVGSVNVSTGAATSMGTISL